MPQSDPWAVPWVMEVVGHADPRSVLDFGVGNGQYGVQLRQSLDIARGRLRPNEWEATIDGVEVFEDYRNPIWGYFYNNVTVGDGAAFLKGAGREYDLIVACDVIEHFDKPDAVELLRLMQSRAKTVVITTPNGAYPQGAVHGNDAECHRSEWTPVDFERMGASTRMIASTFIAVFSGDVAMHQFVRQMPTLFRYSGRELVALTRQWFPRMLRKRFTGAT